MIHGGWDQCRCIDGRARTKTARRTMYLFWKMRRTYRLILSRRETYAEEKKRALSRLFTEAQPKALHSRYWTKRNAKLRYTNEMARLQDNVRNEGRKDEFGLRDQCEDVGGDTTAALRIVPIRRQGFVLVNADTLICLLAEINAVAVGHVTLSSAPLPASFFSPKDNGYILAPIRKRTVLVFLVLVVSSMTRPMLAMDSSPTQSATGTSCQHRITQYLIYSTLSPLSDVGLPAWSTLV